MNRIGFNNAAFMIGPEVEHTPAFSKKTLFVVGKPKLDQIESMAREYKTPHIFMGANHSFTSESLDPYWDHVITTLLDKGFWVTLDYQAHEHETVLKMLNAGIWQCRTFVPLLGVRIPKIQTSSPNLTVKIDDIDFDATNPGVWCYHYHEITDSNRFTDWQDYGTDEVITVEEKATPMPPYTPPVDTSLKVDVKSLKDLQPPVIKKVESDVKNDASLGLDPDAKSVLKEENEEEASVQANVSSNVDSPAAAAEAYATGEAPVKAKKESSKKAESKA